MKYLLWLYFASLPAFVFCQNTIKGKVTDGENRPLEFVNVLLFAQNDTLKLLKGEVSDSLGNFQFQNVGLGKFQLKCQIIGYQTNSLLFEQTSNQNNEIGIIRLEGDNKLLNTIEVTAQKEFFEKTSQGLIVNADASLSQAGGTAVDLLRNTPTVLVDAEGNVSLRGKSPLILLNGRNSSLTNLANIPASSIETIEIINNPSAQYDAEAENGIINIKLKKGRQSGTNGAFALGAGYGIKERLNSSLILNHKKGKWNTGFAYDNRFANRIRKVDSDRTNFNLPEQYFLTQKRNDRRNEQDQNLRLDLDYEDDKNAFTLEAIGSLGVEDNFETLFSTYNTQSNAFTSKNRRFSQELTRDKGAEFALDYERTFEKEDQKLTVNATTSFETEKQNTDIDTQTLTASDSPIDNPFLQRTRNNEKTNITNFRIDYAQPVGKGILETGYKGVLRFLNSDFQNQAQINEEYVSDATSSGILDFKEQIHAIYGQYKQTIGKKEEPSAEFSFGLRAENTNNNGLLIESNTRFGNQYLNLFPTANFTYNLSASKNIRLNYGKRINRPGLGQLNPFTDITDSLSQRSGNPKLKPELIHAFELVYAQDFKKASFIGKLFYRNGTNSIQNFTVLRPDGVLFSQPQNIASTQTYGIESILVYNPTTFWNGNLSFSLFQQKIDAGNISLEVVNNVLSWNTKFINDFSLWKGGKLQIIGIYNSPTATAQGTRIAVYNADFAFQQKIWKDKGRLGLVVTDIFNTQRNGFNWNTADFDSRRRVKVDTRAFLVTFAFTFGTKFKDDLMENKFSND